MQRPTTSVRALFRAAVLLLAVGAGAAPAIADTAPPSAPGAARGPFTIAMVLPREDQNIETSFRASLQRSGVEVRYVPIRATGKAEDIPALRRQIRDARPDLVYVWGTPSTLAVAGKAGDPPGDAIRDIPVVFTEVTDPVGAGLLKSLENHGGNVTGVSHVAPLPTQLNAIRAYRPFKRLGYLHNPAEPNSALVRERLRELARTQDFEVLNADIPLGAGGAPDPAALPGLVRGLAAQKADYLYIGPSTFLAFTHRDLLTQAALDNRLPTFCATESIVRQSGCMVGLFSNGNNIGRFAASKAMQILVDRTPVAQVPASTLQRFSLLVNMRTAAALDLYPPLLLLNVAEVVGVPKTAAADAPPAAR